MTVDSNPVLRAAYDFWRGPPSQPSGLPDFRAGPLRILPPEPRIEVRHGPFQRPA